MRGKTSAEPISRRKALSLIGIVLGLAASPLIESEADAQEAAPAPATHAPATTAPAESTSGTAGMKKRKGRRRSRRTTRHQRREQRTGQPAATPPAGTAQPQ
jgi:hypothetical protein